MLQAETKRSFKSMEVIHSVSKHCNFLEKGNVDNNKK